MLNSFAFANHNRELICTTTDCKVRFYSLNKYEGVFLREIQTVHRAEISSIDISQNGGFMLTGGGDNMVKVWDYEAPKATPQFFQAFIGHINPVTNIRYHPDDNKTVISSGSKDGIYIWSFYGDTTTDFAHDAD
jgi:WD40 repeat protein